MTNVFMSYVRDDQSAVDLWAADLLAPKLRRDGAHPGSLLTVTEFEGSFDAILREGVKLLEKSHRA